MLGGGVERAPRDDQFEQPPRADEYLLDPLGRGAGAARVLLGAREDGPREDHVARLEVFDQRVPGGGEDRRAGGEARG